MDKTSLNLKSIMHDSIDNPWKVICLSNLFQCPNMDPDNLTEEDVEHIMYSALELCRLLATMELMSRHASSDGHLTIMKFTTHWKAMLGTYDMDETSRQEILALPAGDTLGAAISNYWGLVADIMGRMRKEESRTEYYKYIKSPEWKVKSKDAKERAGNRCQLCNKAGENGNLHTHHRTYERLGKELPEDLIVLCSGCHATFHHKVK